MRPTITLLRLVTVVVSAASALRVAHITIVLIVVGFLSFVDAMAAEPVIFHPAYAPGPVDNPLKGFVPYAGQGREFPHALEFNYLSLASMMTGPTNFNWAPMERLLDGVAARPELNLPDGLHPNAEGQRAVAASVLPYVRDLVR